MARVCEVCGKGRSLGNHIETRGKAKYLGGVGTKVTGITRRTFLPNLQNVRITTTNGTTKTVRVCTQCVRSGAVRKQVRNAPFRVAHEDAVGLAKAPVAKQPVKKAAVKKTVVKKTAKKTETKAAAPSKK